MIFQVIFDRAHDKQGSPLICRVYQGIYLVGKGGGADALSAVTDAFADMQRRNLVAVEGSVCNTIK